MASVFTIRTRAEVVCGGINIPSLLSSDIFDDSMTCDGSCGRMFRKFGRGLRQAIDKYGSVNLQNEDKRDKLMKLLCRSWVWSNLKEVLEPIREILFTLLQESRQELQDLVTLSVLLFEAYVLEYEDYTTCVSLL
jgi:hypothetical protein